MNNIKKPIAIAFISIPFLCMMVTLILLNGWMGVVWFICTFVASIIVMLIVSVILAMLPERYIVEKKKMRKV